MEKRKNEEKREEQAPAREKRRDAGGELVHADGAPPKEPGGKREVRHGG